MAGADAIAGAAGAGLIAGGTPFGWAQLGAGLLSGASGAASQPQVIDSGRGGAFLNFDNSGWTVATSGSKASATAGDRGGMSGGTGMLGSGVSSALVSSMPWGSLMIAGGILLVVMLVKRKG